MVIVLVVSSVLVTAALVSVRIFRPKADAIRQYQRALAALRDAERSRPSSSVETHPEPARTDHVHILDAPPASRVGIRRRSRPARRSSTVRRRNAAEIAARPTIARLPTVWLSAPAGRPAFVELTPATLAPDHRGPEELVTAEPDAPAGPSSEGDS